MLQARLRGGLVDVGAWLRELGLGEYERAFRDNHIDAALLPELTADDLIGLGIVSIGHRRKLLAGIAGLPPGSGRAQATFARPLEVISGAAPSPDEAERRQLTVMFCDLVGSTALAARLDPEDLRDVIAAYHTCIAETIARFNGFVAKYMGDGVLVYFGYPRAHEDDAERAVRAGLDLVPEVRALKPHADIELHIRVGIATGLVVVGDLIGAGAAQERAVVGETPNLAARLQSIAGPDSIVIAASTRRLTGGLFDYEDLGGVEAKGYAEPVRAWCVRGESTLASRFEALRSGETPLVGREEELDMLLRRWQRAKGGEGQVVSIAGEPGIGKSRFTAAVEDRLLDEPHTRLRFFCLPHHQDSALHPIIAQLERAAGFAREDTSKMKFDRLEALLGPDTTSAEDITLLAELLSLPTPEGYPSLSLTPQRRREQILAALLRQLEGLARRRPVLMIFEDVHWSDPTSRELLDHIVERACDWPFLLVITSRPEFQPPWTGQAHTTLLALRRLHRRAAATLAQRIAGQKDLPANLLAGILERTDGVPLFIEELTKAVLDASGGGTESAIAAVPLTAWSVPATLHASLMARLDRLDPTTKEIAQIGAAIGREFTYELLAHVSTLPESALRDALTQLAASGLVSQRGSPPDASYLYKHALVQDAAYGTLLRARRKEWHARIAAALQHQLPETVAARPEVLARHLSEAGQPAQAVGLWIAAGQQALGQAAHGEASAFFERALGALAAQEETPEAQMAIIDLRRQLHQALYPLGHLQHARANLAEAERVAARLGDAVRLARVLSSQIYLLSATGDLAGAIEAGERVLSLLAEQDDLDAAVNTRLMLARALYAAGQYGEALRRAREAVALLGEDVDRGAMGGLNQTVSARVWLTLCHAERGEFEIGAALGATALRLAAHPRCSEHEALWSRLGVGRLRVVGNDLAGACEVLEPALPLCKGDHAIYFSRVAASLGMAYSGSGRIDEGVGLLRQADEQAQALGFTFGHALVLAQLGAALLLAGDLDRAQEVALCAVDAAERWSERGNEAWARCLLGDTAAARLDTQAARVHYREALSIGEALSMAPVQSRCSDGLVRLARL